MAEMGLEGLANQLFWSSIFFLCALKAYFFQKERQRKQKIAGLMGWWFLIAFVNLSCLIHSYWGGYGSIDASAGWIIVTSWQGSLPWYVRTTGAGWNYISAYMQIIYIDLRYLRLLAGFGPCGLDFLICLVNSTDNWDYNGLIQDIWTSLAASWFPFRFFCKKQSFRSHRKSP